MEELSPRRKPTPKLKFPILGDAFDGGDEMSGNSMMFLFGAMVVFIIGYSIYQFKKGDGVLRGPKTLINAEWKGRVTKKYMGYDRPNINMFDMIEADDIRPQKIDVSADSSKFFEIIMPRDSIFKAKGELKVRIKNYTRDTTVTMDFPN